VQGIPNIPIFLRGFIMNIDQYGFYNDINDGVGTSFIDDGDFFNGDEEIVTSFSIDDGFFSNSIDDGDFFNGIES
jgi:hypothetical protein